MDYCHRENTTIGNSFISEEPVGCFAIALQRGRLFYPVNMRRYKTNHSLHNKSPNRACTVDLVSLCMPLPLESILYC